MKKKRWSCAFLGMNTLVHRVGALLAVSTLLVLGTSTLVMAKCDGDGICERGENAKNCAADCTAGEPPPTGALTANLSGGTFVFAFGPKSVVLNAKKNTATSEQDVELTRPGAGALRCEWDSVLTGVDEAGCPGTMFDGCRLLETPVDDLMFGDDDWRIFFGSVDGGGLRVAFSNSLEDGVEDGVDIGVETVEIRLQLIDSVPDYVAHPIPPALTGRSEFTLTDFILAGDTVRGISPRRTCQPGPGSGGGLERFTLTNHSTLTICGEDLLGTGDNCSGADECCSNVCTSGVCAF